MDFECVKLRGDPVQTEEYPNLSSAFSSLSFDPIRNIYFRQRRRPLSALGLITDFEIRNHFIKNGQNNNNPA